MNFIVNIVLGKVSMVSLKGLPDGDVGFQKISFTSPPRLPVGQVSKIRFFESRRGILDMAIVFLLLFLLPISGLAQVGKANRHFEKQKYDRAIDLYEKALDKNYDNRSLKRLWQSYDQLDSFGRAIAYFKPKTENTDHPEYLFYYGLSLLNQGKYQEAKDQFTVYSVIGDDPEKAKMFLKRAETLQALSKQPDSYRVRPFSKINTAYSELAPVMYKNGVVFTTSRRVDMVNDVISPGGQPYLAIYYLQGDSLGGDPMFEKTSGEPELFAKALEFELHDGPVTFNKAGDEAWFNRTLRKSSTDTNRLGLFHAKLIDGKWKVVGGFSFNNEYHSFAHPSLSADGKMLFFSSDMPGGYGGKDIYYSKKEGDGWSRPVNAGDQVNTGGDEVFPSISKEGKLYFASNGHISFGGLDVFTATQESGVWTNITHLKPPLNSAYDDFGIALMDKGKEGYFTSNRPGGQGGDDIWYFKEIAYTAVEGVVLADDTKPVKGTRILLMNKDQTILDSAYTDAMGRFRFEQLPSDNSYLVLIDAEDTKLRLQDQGINKIQSLSGQLLENSKVSVEEIEIRLVNKGMEALRATLTNKKGTFRFEKLPSDKEEGLSLLEVPDPGLYMEAFSGQISYNDTVPAKGIRVFLTNENKHIIDTTYTNELGQFNFEQLPTDKTYLVLIDAEDAKLALKTDRIEFLQSLSGNLLRSGNSNSRITIQIVDKDMKTIKAIDVDSKGQFKFERLPSEKSGGLALLEAEDTGLSDKVFVSGKVSYNEGKAISGVKVSIVDENRDVLGTTTTDEFGNFKFENLPSDKTFLVLLDAEDTRLVLETGGVKKLSSISGTLIQSNNQGKIQVQLVDKELEKLRSIEMKDDGTFAFEKKAEEDDLALLESDDKKTEEISDEDKKLVNMETVYYGFDKYQITSDAKQKLDQLVTVLKKNPAYRIELGAYTDEVGSSDYNLFLSNKRAIEVMNYLVEKGIDSRRVSGKGYGISREEKSHSLNRKTECRVYTVK